MSTVSSLLGSGSASPSSSSTAATGGLTGLKPMDFINMMITQLQNQDPTSPTSNQEILQQISQIGQLQSSNDLTTSLKSMVLQNNIGAASNLIGKSVTGLDSKGAPLGGTVNSVKVQGNDVALLLDNGSSLPLSSVTNISRTTPTATATTGGTPAVKGA